MACICMCSMGQVGRSLNLRVCAIAQCHKRQQTPAIFNSWIESILNTKPVLYLRPTGMVEANNCYKRRETNCGWRRRHYWGIRKGWDFIICPVGRRRLVFGAHVVCTRWCKLLLGCLPAQRHCRPPLHRRVSCRVLMVQLFVCRFYAGSRIDRQILGGFGMSNRTRA